ncbi:tRNA (guanosine(46)-N7)-methyltransferase TrmB [Ruminococcaceae bacterium OttesenSCG-928-O06]|nr:tRNA (guanosine(46)-N7)-methyltransferase TrmB [Ruminococcaceae bacterium OttesenSCG-928-O06]
MRMRFKPYARPELAAWPYHIDAPAALRGRWNTAFSNPALPLRVEFGCGKGGFLAAVALRDADANHLGIDIKSEMLVVAKRKMERLFAENEQTLDNLRITCQEIEQVDAILAPEDRVERLYINFCNPWYKSGHAKHRLTHPRQLAKARDFLVPDGEIWFKTDDTPLFNDSLRYFAYTGFAVVWQSWDLHREEPAWNIRTEHEEMFAAKGIPIKACIARMCPAQLDREEISRLKNI